MRSGLFLSPCKQWSRISSLPTVLSAATVPCQSCNISTLFTSPPSSSSCGETPHFFRDLSCLLVFNPAAAGSFIFRPCLTSCFSAGAPIMTCPRKWLIGSGWSWGRWSPRSSAIRRHGEYLVYLNTRFFLFYFF